MVPKGKSLTWNFRLWVQNSRYYFAACWVDLAGAHRCTLMCIRFPPGPLCQALLPLKVLSISILLHLLQNLHPTIP